MAHHRSDDELGAIIAAVRPFESREKFKQRGELLMSHARRVRKERRQGLGRLLTVLSCFERVLIAIAPLADLVVERIDQGQMATASLAEHVADRINRFHDDYAIRAGDTIAVEERALQKVAGRGGYQRWLPAAVLRCCWGLRPRPRPLRG